MFMGILKIFSYYLLDTFGIFTYNYFKIEQYNFLIFKKIRISKEEFFETFIF